MGFSEDTKQELFQMQVERYCCCLAELAAYYDFGGYLLGRQEVYLDFYTSSPKVARRILSLLKEQFPAIATQVLIKKAKARRNQVCLVRVQSDSGARQIHDAIVSLEYEGSPHVYRRRCCRCAYLRGSFLSHGYVSNPNRPYHLELVADKSQVAVKVYDNAVSLCIETGISTRKENHVVYVKEGDSVASILALMGAHQALLHFENVRVVKDMRSRVNRLVNAETANVDKTVRAAMAQLEDIHYIQQHMPLADLPDKTAEVARMRLAQPYASLAELGQGLTPALSKPAVYHHVCRLRAIRQRLDQTEPDHGSAD